MKKGHTYWQIVKYIKSKGWKIDPVDGTFCAGRRKDDSSQLLMSAFMKVDEPDCFLKIIATDDDQDSKNITLGFYYDIKEGEEYRIDYEVDKPKKGWHLDSDKYSISHRMLPEIKDWKDAVDLIIFQIIGLVPLDYFKRK